MMTASQMMTAWIESLSLPPHNLSYRRDLRNLNNPNFPQTATLQRGKECRDNIARR
jgi:hypothetical protein